MARDVIDTLSGLTLFADLPRPQLEAVAHTFEEQVFPAEHSVLRQGFHGTGFYVIIEGEAVVRIDGEDRSRLARGDFFGEISILLDEPPSADVIALGTLRCVVLGGGQVADFLQANPPVMFRMLQALARRLRSASQWRP